MTRFGWGLPPGVRDSDIDRDAERLDRYDPDAAWEAREFEREIDALYPDEPPCDAPRPSYPLEIDLQPDDRCHRCDCRYVRRYGEEMLCESCYEMAAEDEE